MKVIAQAQVPSAPSFIQIAHVAATTPGKMLGIFEFVLIAGALGLYAVKRKSAVWKLGVAAFVVAVAACLYFLVPTTYAHPDWATRAWAQQVYVSTVALQAKHVPVPGNAQQLDRQLKRCTGHTLANTKDAWGRGFRIMSYKDSSGTQYRVVSAGADGRFGSKDDIAYPQTAGKR